MNGKNFMLLGLVLTGLLLPQCERGPSLEGQVEDHPVYFEYRYRNWAWGIQDTGWLIDGTGVVKGFTFPEGFEEGDSTGLISLDALVYNLVLCDTIMDRVPRADLVHYTSMIPGAADGEIGEPRQIAADAGLSEFHAFLWLEEEEMYQKVFLACSGNVERFNLSGEAEVLVDWLLEFGADWMSDYQ